jgi:hypothetical protein
MTRIGHSPDVLSRVEESGLGSVSRPGLGVEVRRRLLNLGLPPKPGATRLFVARAPLIQAVPVHETGPDEPI